MSESNKIVVVGSCMMDFVSYAPRLPKQGETIHGSKFITTFGGKGANQCFAATLLGGNTALVARVGDDIWGGKYIEHLKENNVDTRYVMKTRDYATGIAQITVSDSGQNQIVIVAGANTQLSVADLEETEPLISEAEVVVCQLETSVDVAIKACTLCTNISILNGAPGLKEYDPPLLALPTIFCVNEIEAEDFSGIPVKSIEDAKVASNELLKKGCNTVILTLGAHGAVYATENNTEYISAPCVKCVDSTGAGDSFIGALSYLLANRKDLEMTEIIKISCYVATDSVTRPGTQISFASADIIKKYFKEKESGTN